MRNHRHRQRAIDRLTTSHRDSVVEENFVGDVDLGRNRGANRQQAGVVVSAVAEIGKNMFGLGEGLNTNPRHALPAHLRERHRLFRANPRCHVVAADTRERFRALRHNGAGVMRAAGTERRNTYRLRTRTLQCSFLVFNKF